MKKKIFYVLMIACIGMTSIVNTSCSNQTDLVANEQQEKAGAEGVLISFGLSAEDYGTDTEVGTRGISNAQSGRVIATSTANIGNGLEVLTEVVEDNAPKTRAGREAVTAQYYTILAYKDGKKVAEWNGRSTGTDFNLSAGQTALKHLQPGTYKFYVFNDQHMSVSGKGNLYTSIKRGSRNAYYLAKDVTIQNVKRQKLEFVLKPMFARVRTKFKAYMDGAFSGPLYGNSSFKQGTIPSDRYINPATGEATNILVARDSSLYYGNLEESGQGTEGENGAIKFYYRMTPDYTGNFFLEGTKLNKISFKFENRGDMSIFRQNVANMIIENKLNSDVTLEAGKSYTLVFTMYKKADYVFLLNNNGDVSVGSILANKGKTPVALVVDKDKKLAIAIKDLNGTAPWVTDNAYRAKTLYPQTVEGLAQIVGKYEGYLESSNKNYTLNNKSKGIARDYEYKFTAFNNVSNLLMVDYVVRYIPGGGEWNAALKYFGIANPSNGFNASSAVENRWGGDFGYGLQEALFYQVGGKPLNGTYWGAQEWTGNKALTVTATSTGAYFGGMATNSQGLVRPFIKY